MDLLGVLIPVGLALDLLGVVLLLAFGNARSIWVGSGPPRADLGRDGDTYFAIEGDQQGIPSIAKQERRERCRRIIWRIAVGLIVVGFTLQLVGSIITL